MDSSLRVLLFQLVHFITFFLFLIPSLCALLRPQYCFEGEGGIHSVCGTPIEYPSAYNMPGAGDSCGYPGLEISCSAQYGGRASINISNHVYYVIDPDYKYKRIRLVDMEVQQEECAQPTRNFSFPSSPSWVTYYLDTTTMSMATVFYNCSSVPLNANQLLLCNNSLPSYILYNDDLIIDGSQWYQNCAQNVIVPMYYLGENYTNSDAIKMGFDMKWSTTDWCRDCELSGGLCWSIQNSTGCACRNNTSYNRMCPPQAPPPLHAPPPHQVQPGTNSISESHPHKKGMTTGLKIMIGVSGGIGGLVLVALFVFCRGVICSSLKFSWRKNKNKSPVDVEVFLERYGCLALQRYKYTHIKKMTNSFKDILGQGGYGRVFKGELPNGHLVAVKVLNESRGDGGDFVNEVATIGRTNHVNIVNLIGFCSEGSRRALVYEFMPNGSLERFIYAQKESPITMLLGSEKLYEIALGVARGLEYLHRGCNMRILHFDIKPHNILLDQDFCPKISDFGLAKLYPTRESIVSTVGARGTTGYIAPELCCRNFGSASHKSDVYSYGMMMLEMIGGRKNIDVTVENISEIYFPFWVYNHLIRNNDANDLEDIHVRVLFEDGTTKKMLIVALWCIQAHPMERPSMSKVVEMLEGDTHELKIPPNPSVDPRPHYSS